MLTGADKRYIQQQDGRVHRGIQRQSTLPLTASTTSRPATPGIALCGPNSALRLPW